MRRFLLNFFTTVSLLMAMAVAALWWRSYSVPDWVTGQAGEYQFELWHPDGGRLAVGVELWLNRNTADPETWTWTWHLGPPSRLATKMTRSLAFAMLEPARFLGFEYSTGAMPGGSAITLAKCWQIVVPYWFLLALTLVVPGFRVRAALRERRVRRWFRDELCLYCGYDVRSTPEKGKGIFERCPECGTETARSAPPMLKRRIARGVLTTVTMLCLIASMVVCVMWVRSYWQAERVVWHCRPVRYAYYSYTYDTAYSPGISVAVGSVCGEACVVYSTADRHPMQWPPDWPTDLSRWRDEGDTHYVRYEARQRTSGGRATPNSEASAEDLFWQISRPDASWSCPCFLVIPYWLLMAATALFPAVRFVRWLARRCPNRTWPAPLTSPTPSPSS